MFVFFCAKNKFLFFFTAQYGYASGLKCCEPSLSPAVLWLLLWLLC